MDGNPPPLFETSSKYSEPAQVTDEVYAAKKKAKRVADRYQLPEGYSIYHSGTGIGRTGEIESNNMTSVLHDDNYGAVGSVNWDPRSGHIRGFYMDEDARPYASHLLNAAHDYAAQEGVDGPTHSNEMTDYSYNMAKKLVPSAIPKNATVGDAPLHFRSEEFLSTLHSMKSQAHLLEAQTLQTHPTFAAVRVTDRPSAYIGAAIEAHHTGFHHEIKEHLMDAADNASDIRVSVGMSPHPDANELSETWRDFAGHIDRTLHETGANYG